jgi:hypothetical protein
MPVFAFPPDGRAHLAWFYKPPADGNLAALADRFDAFILTRNDERTRDALLAYGARPPILRYLFLNVIQNPGDCMAAPFHDQIADAPGDFCLITSQHPDWFLRDAQGRPLNDGEYFFMDPDSAGWRAFWLERLRQSQAQLGWGGIFLDNADSTLEQIRTRFHAVPAAYPDDAHFQAAEADLLRYLRTNYFSPQRQPMVANIVGAAESNVWTLYIQYLDGAMLEAFAVDWTSGFLPADQWQAQIMIAWQTQQSGKAVFLVSQGERLDAVREQFALASYLLVQHGNAYFRYADHQSYEEVWWYENYEIDLGQPLGPPAASEQNIWHREFANGYVTVDPNAHTSAIVVR